MDIKRLPPSLLVALGLAGCGPSVGPDDDSAGEGSATGTGTGTEVSTSACLDIDPSATGSTGVFTTGPCLGQELTTSGPCLAPEVTTGTDEGSGSGEGSDGGSGTAGEETTTGPCLAPKGDALPPDETHAAPSPGGAPARAEVLERLRAAGVLPPDVAAKLGGA